MFLTYLWFAEMYVANIYHGDFLLYFHCIRIDSDKACVTLLLQDFFFFSFWTFETLESDKVERLQYLINHSSWVTVSAGVKQHQILELI